MSSNSLSPKLQRKLDQLYEHAPVLRQAQEQGVQFIACEMSMNVMEIKKEDLIDGVQIGGVASFIAEASESKIQLFI